MVANVNCIEIFPILNDLRRNVLRVPARAHIWALVNPLPNMVKNETLRARFVTAHTCSQVVGVRVLPFSIVASINHKN